MHARGCHGVMVVLQWLPGHYTIGVRWYMAGGHGSMLWVQPFGDDDVANKIDDLQVLGAISKF